MSYIWKYAEAILDMRTEKNANKIINKVKQTNISP